MADFVSHHLFGRQALTVFPAPAQRAAACVGVLFLGLSGPDPLFYRKILLGSPLHLRRLLMNIISNAVKYNHAGGEVRLECREKAECGSGDCTD